MDERSGLVETLMDKRDRLNEQAHQQREVRDRLNDQTKSHSARRDEFNAQVRSLIDRANQHRSKRDELNARVRQAKQARDQLNREAQERNEQLQELRKERGGTGGGESLGKLRAEVRRLEYQQQTTALSPKKEKELIDLIGSKLKEIKEREAAMAENADLQQAYDAMREAKERAEEQHAAVTALANEAQGEHDQMVKLFGEADKIRKLADAAQGDFVKSKTEADKVHREYIECVMSVRDLDRVLYNLRPSPERPMPTAGERAEADDIFDKFRKGEKLSTEDLMALQKGGRL